MTLDEVVKMVAEDWDARSKPMDEAIILDEKRGDTRVIEYQPGNGTRYVFTFTNLEEFSERTQGRTGLYKGSHLVNWVTEPKNIRSIIYNQGRYLDHDFLVRLTKNIADQFAIGTLLSYVFDTHFYGNDLSY